MCIRVLRAFLVIVSIVGPARPVRAGEEPGARPPQTPNDPVPSLALLVRDAVARNLAIESGRLTPALAAADVQAARGAFDAQFQLQPGFARTSQSIATPDGPLSSTLSTTTLTGGVAGLLPYSAVAVAGNLPTGTQYGVSLQSARRSQDPLAGTGQAYPVQFDTTLTLSFAHPLLRGSGSAIGHAGIRAATMGFEASRAGFARTVDLTVSQVETAYWTYVLARSLETVAADSLGRAETLLARNEQLLQLQLLASIDVLTARQGVAARQQAFTQAQQQREDAADAVVFLVYGREARAHLADPIAAEGTRLPEAAPDASDVNRVEEEAIRGRPDLMAAERLLDRARIGVEVARDSLRPGVYLTGAFTALTNNASMLRLAGIDRAGEIAATRWQAGVQVNVPVGNNIAKAGFRQATLAESQSQFAISNVQNQILQEVRQAVRAIRASAERVREATDALNLAVQAYEAETERLQLGFSDSFRVLQFEEQEAQAQQTQLLARFSLAEAIASYDLARGSSAAKYGIVDASAGGEIPSPAISR